MTSLYSIIPYVMKVYERKEYYSRNKEEGKS